MRRRGSRNSDTQLIPRNFLLVLNARNTDWQVSSAEHLNEKYFPVHDLKIKRVAPAVFLLTELRPRHKTACSGNTAGAQAGLG